MSNISERAIQATDIDAVEAKTSAVKLGYWKDPYIKYFTCEKRLKAPEINRGYFARTQSIEAITKEFIKFNNNSQIINVGCGSDTLYLRLLDENIIPTKFVEIDLLENVMRKISQFQQKKVLSEKLHQKSSDKILDNISMDPYYLFSFDLRVNQEQLFDLLKREANIDFDSPTLFIAECVFVYINSEDVDKFLMTASNFFSSSAILCYDPVSMVDAFGKMMVSNLKMRHIDLNGISACTSKETHIDRFKKANFPDVKIWLISEVYKAFSKQTTKRIESIEMLDDPEMMKQLFDHYCLVLAMTKSELMRHSDLSDILMIIE